MLPDLADENAAADAEGFAAALAFQPVLDADRLALEPLHPRLRAARALLDTGRVRIDGELIQVAGAATTYAVRSTPEGYRTRNR